MPSGISARARTPETSLLLQAINASSNGIVISDARQPDNPLVFVNSAFEVMTGYSASEVIGRNCRFLQGEHANQPCLNVLRKALRDHKPCVVTIRNVRKDTSAFWNELSVSPVFNRSGVLTHYIGVQRDISRQVAADRLLRQKQAALSRANRQLELLVNRDGLTGVFNRRYLDAELKRLWNMNRRQRQPLSVLMIDIDYFKRYNDTHGHQAGDECLRMVASFLEAQFARSSDLVARYGGEEFVIVAPSTPPEKLLAVGKRLCQGVRRLRIPHSASETGPFVTISVGCASMIPGPRTDSKQLLAIADAALYRAKGEGRNRAVGGGLS